MPQAQAYPASAAQAYPVSEEPRAQAYPVSDEPRGGLGVLSER